MELILKELVMIKIFYWLFIILFVFMAIIGPIVGEYRYTAAVVLCLILKIAYGKKK